jgi:hypothetical protein
MGFSGLQVYEVHFRAFSLDGIVAEAAVRPEPVEGPLFSSRKG